MSRSRPGKGAGVRGPRRRVRAILQSGTDQHGGWRTMALECGHEVRVHTKSPVWGRCIECLRAAQPETTQEGT